MLAYVIIATLVYPGDYERVYEFGTDIPTLQECQVAAKKTVFQLEETLSVAQLVSVQCLKTIKI